MKLKQLTSVGRLILVQQLFVCFLINWLCVIVPRYEPKHLKRKWIIDGGRVLMAITNTLMMVQAGYPTGICVVCSRESNY